MTEMSAWARSIGYKIRQCRLARGLTQEQLAAGIFSKSYISQLERGSVNPSLRALRLLAARLGVSCTWLLESNSSPPTLLLKAASTSYYLGDCDEAERVLCQAQAHSEAFTHRDHVEALLLKARIGSTRRDWKAVIDACTRIDHLQESIDSLPRRHAVSQRYLWGRAWFYLGNRRLAIHHWEAGLAELLHCSGPPSHEGLLLMNEIAELYAALGDLQSSHSVRTRAMATAAQMLSNTDLSRWVLARRHESSAPGEAVLKVDHDGDLEDAEAWARASLLLATAAEFRQRIVETR